VKPVIRRTLQSWADLDEIWVYIAHNSES